MKVLIEYGFRYALEVGFNPNDRIWFQICSGGWFQS